MPTGGVAPLKSCDGMGGGPLKSDPLRWASKVCFCRHSMSTSEHQSAIEFTNRALTPNCQQEMFRFEYNKKVYSNCKIVVAISERNITDTGMAEPHRRKLLRGILPASSRRKWAMMEFIFEFL